MRRRSDPAVEPPARLRYFDPANWNSVDGLDLLPICAGSAERRWAHLQFRAWCSARLAYHAEHGWPGGDCVSLISEHVRIRLALSGAERRI